MSDPLFTVLLPVLRPPYLLPFSIECVLAQTERNFELCVICDGAPEETTACAQGYAARDARVKVFAFPKGEGRGEAYRHKILNDATSRYVAHICDDDLWLPHHLDELSKLLADADFGNLPQIQVTPRSELAPVFGDLAEAATRHRMLTSRWNLFGPTVCGYRLDAYRKLNTGWTTAPPDIWSDLHMWRKFLARDDFTVTTRFAVTALTFQTPPRREMPIEERASEIRHWRERIRQPEMHDVLTQEVLKIALRAAGNHRSSPDKLHRLLDEQAALHEALWRQKRQIAPALDGFYWRLRTGIRQLRRRIRNALGR